MVMIECIESKEDFNEYSLILSEFDFAPKLCAVTWAPCRALPPPTESFLRITGKNQHHSMNVSAMYKKPNKNDCKCNVLVAI